MSCSICINNFNNSNCIAVNCDFCQFTACRKCNQKYILEQKEHAHCMNCKHEWNRDVLFNKFSKKFVNAEYKKHRENILFDTERSLLPATQQYLQKIMEREKIYNQIYELQSKIFDLRKSLNKPQAEKSIFTKKCPNHDCRGFLSTQWKCGLCEYWTCPDCHEIKGHSREAEHTCKKENVETAKLIQKETRACPKCGVNIYKILGCDQMWCTQCHTPFSWKTGKIETVTIHNPHFFEWLKKNGRLERNPNDIQCGREIDINFASEIECMVIFEICRKLIHIRRVELPRLTPHAQNENEDLRIKYMKSEIDEKTFKLRIQRREKEQNKKREIANIIGMFVASATDILYRYKHESKSEKISTENYSNKYINEIENLRLYTNECFEKMSYVFNCKNYILNKNFVIIRK